MEKEVHTVEKTVFLKRGSVFPKEGFYKKSQTSKEGNEKISRQDKKDGDGIFLKRLFIHNKRNY